MCTYKNGLLKTGRFAWCAQHGRTPAVKEYVLTWGDLALCLKGDVVTRSESGKPCAAGRSMLPSLRCCGKSAEAVPQVDFLRGIVAAGLEQRAEREGVFCAISMREAKRQVAEKLGRVPEVGGEAARASTSDEARRPRHETGSTGLALLMAALTRENLQQAWRRVKPIKAQVAWMVGAYPKPPAICNLVAGNP